MPRKSSKRNRLGRAKDRAKKKPAKKESAKEPVEDPKGIDITLGSGGGAADLVRSSIPRVSPQRTGGGFVNMPDTDPFQQRHLAAPRNRMSSGGKVGSKSRDGIASRGFTKGRFV